MKQCKRCEVYEILKDRGIVKSMWAKIWNWIKKFFDWLSDFCNVLGFVVTVATILAH